MWMLHCNYSTLRTLSINQQTRTDSLHKRAVQREHHSLSNSNRVQDPDSAALRSQYSFHEVGVRVVGTCIKIGGSPALAVNIVMLLIFRGFIVVHYHKHDRKHTQGNIGFMIGCCR